MLFKYIILFIEVAMVLFALIKLAKKKRYLQQFPDGFKEQYMKSSRIMTLLSLISALLILFSFIMITTNAFFFFAILAMFLSSHAIISIFEEFQDLEDSSSEIASE